MSDEPHYLRAELESLVRQDSRIFRFLQEGSLDGVWYWDLEYPDVEWMSPRFWSTLGWDPDQRKHLAAEWQDLIHPDDLQEALANFEAHRLDPDHPYDQDVRYRSPDGSWTWVRCRGLIIRDESGRALRMLGAHNDITALKRAEVEVREQAEQLERANGELRAFIQAASHDLKAPVRRIRLFASMLEEELEGHDSEDVRDGLSGILRSAQEMEGMIGGLLEIARAGSATMQIEEVDLTALAREVASGLAREHTDLDVSIGSLGVMATDRGWLARVFENLFANAHRYQHPDRPLHVDVRREGGRVVIADNGRGVAEDEQNRVFQPFYRGSASVGRSGHGLGLSICARVVERLGGNIGVGPTPGGGACFWLDFSGLWVEG